jgi:2-keto-4-pentenoate hydratase/2-oxohepta-3-ene-1,7-dioic acid hydratase in catechol pathway
MRFVTFSDKSGAGRLGAVIDDMIVELDGTMLGLLQGGPAALDAARASLKKAAATRPLKDARLKAALPDPGALRDFFAFEEHAKAGAKRRDEELPGEWYEIPAYYKGNHREIYGPEDTIPWPSYTRKLDFECEIACVVGKQGRNLTPEAAADHIFGYMIFNDVSARDIQRKEMLLRMGPTKGKDFANVFGPMLVTADEVDPRALTMKIRVNGEIWSEGRFRDQHWGFPTMVSYVSQEETVHPGDVFGSGTFYKGCGLDLDRWVKPGDVLELEVPGLGTLRNTIGTPSKQEQLDYGRYAAHGAHT